MEWNGPVSPLRHLRRRVHLTPMTPVQQLRAGRLAPRIVQLMVGLWLFGTAIAMFVRSRLGLAPWDVLHSGLQRVVGISFGTVMIVVGAVVLLLWIPLRQWPGLGTVLNIVVIGIAADVTLLWLPEPSDLVWRWVLFFVAILLNGFAGALYIGSQLGPGPRDGLMTGFAYRTGWSIRLVRTLIEVTVLVIGWALGGVVGVGTVLFALLIGPATQLFLPMVTVRVQHDGPVGPVGPAGAEAEVA